MVQNFRVRRLLRHSVGADIVKLFFRHRLNIPKFTRFSDLKSHLKRLHLFCSRIYLPTYQWCKFILSPRKFYTKTLIAGWWFQSRERERGANKIIILLSKCQCSVRGLNLDAKSLHFQEQIIQISATVETVLCSSVIIFLSFTMVVWYTNQCDQIGWNLPTFAKFQVLGKSFRSYLVFVQNAETTLTN